MPETFFVAEMSPLLLRVALAPPTNWNLQALVTVPRVQAWIWVGSKKHQFLERDLLRLHSDR